MMKLADNFRFALAAVAIIWAIHLLNGFLPIDLRSFGLRPRSIDGLWGILTAPFLHANLPHLIANTGALFVLLIVSLSYNRRLTFSALWIIILLGGGLVWLAGSTNSIHIGASGVIFGLIGFLMFIGIFRGEWGALVLSIVIFFLYGGALLSLLAVVPGVSWTGHLFGFLSGVLAARWTRRWS